MKTNGGYIILDLQDANVYAQAQNCLLANKPVMVYDNTQVYYADSIILDGTNVILTKGGKTITIADDNTITTSGDIQTTTLELTIDADDFATLDNFDNFVITKDLYDKLLSGKYVIKANLYDDVDFIGFPNWVSDEVVLTNALVDTHFIMEYLDTADNGDCYLVIGQLKDERYFLICDNNSH